MDYTDLIKRKKLELEQLDKDSKRAGELRFELQALSKGINMTLTGLDVDDYDDDDDDEDEYTQSDDERERQSWLAGFTARQAHYHSR